MLFDSLLMFSSGQDIHAASVASTNSVPLGQRSNYDDAWTPPTSPGTGHAGNSNVGAGNRVKLAGVIQGAVLSGETPTLTISLQDSNDNSSFTNIAVGPAITGDALVALAATGYAFVFTVPDNTRKYLQMYYTIGGTGGFTALTATAGVVIDSQSNGVW